jgi:uncharacterized damage-inducible protein DinB
MLTELLELFAYNRWAHERTLAAAAELTAEQYAAPLAGSFPSLRATLEHLFGTEAVWMARWQGNPLGVAPDLADCGDAAALARRWAELWGEQSRFLAGLGEGEIARPVHARFRSGVETDLPLGETLRHVVNHATYHRGQAATLTRQLGGTPAPTDYITFWMLREAERRAPSGHAARSAV